MPERPSIAFFGSSLVSAYWNGAATYYRGIIRALHGRGFQVTFFEPDALDRQRHRDIPDPIWARVVVWSPTADGVEGALDEARSADIVIKASGVGVHDEFLEQEVSGMGSESRQTLFWDVDAPATLARLEEDPEDSFRAAIPRFDGILTYGGGPPVREAYRSLGARECRAIHNAVDPLTHHPVTPDSRFQGLLAFLGNRLPDREARVREFFLEPAAARPGQTFLLGGSGWDGGEDGFPSNVRCLGHVSPADHNAFNCSPLAVISINRDRMAATGWSPATRMFEAAGAGACMISDTWPGLEDFLEPGREVLTARDGEEVRSHLEFLTEQRASDLGRAARRRVLAQHTYEDRADQLETILDTRRQPAHEGGSRWTP